MFRLADPDATYTHPVTVAVPAGDGRPAAQRYTARFRVLPASESERLAHEGDDALIRAALAGWELIADHEGNALEFSDETLARLVEIPYWRRATALAYLEFSAGLPAKNSEPLPATR